MSEEMTKTAEEQLADIVKAEAGAIAETKADAAVVAELKSALEATKAELEEVKSASATALETKAAELEEMVETKMNAPMVNHNAPDERLEQWWNFGEIKSLDERQEDRIELKYDLVSGKTFRKAENSTNNAADVPVGGVPVVAAINEMNPFRMLASVIPVASGSFKIPSLGSVTANKNQNAGAQTEAGAVDATTVNVNHYNSYFTSSIAFAEDSMGLDQIVTRRQMSEIGNIEATDCVSVLDGATITEHTFANGAAFDDIGNWIDLVSALDVQYRENATLVVNTEAYGSLRGATTANTASALEFDVTTRSPLFLGFPVVVTGHLDDLGASANPAYFGDFSQGLIIGDRQSLNMRRLVDTVVLDGVAYYMSMRSGQGIGVNSALVRADQTAA